MGLFNFNTDVKERAKKREFKVPEAGSYTLIIQNAVFKYSKAKNAMIEITYSIDSSLDGDETFKNSKVWDKLMLMPSCVWRIEDFCDATGYELPEGEIEVEHITEMIGELTGMLVDVETEVEDYIDKYGKPQKKASITKFIPLVKDTKIDKL